MNHQFHHEVWEFRSSLTYQLNDINQLVRASFQIICFENDLTFIFWTTVLWKYLVRSSGNTRANCVIIDIGARFKNYTAYILLSAYTGIIISGNFYKNQHGCNVIRGGVVSCDHAHTFIDSTMITTVLKANHVENDEKSLNIHWNLH